MEFKGSAAVEHFSKALDGESDRGKVIVISAFFDERLGTLLGDGMNRSFYTRIEECRNAGLLTQHESDDLHSIRGLRNAFAHKLQARSFDASADLAVDQFKLWQAARAAIGIGGLIQSTEQKLTYVAGIIAFRLERRPARPNPGPLPEPPIFDTSAWPPLIGR